MNTYAKMGRGWLVGFSNQLLVLSSDKSAWESRGFYRIKESLRRATLRRLRDGLRQHG